MTEEGRRNFAVLIEWLEEEEARHDERCAAFLAKVVE